MTVSWKSLENKWREQLLSHTVGNILEVGVEEGMNFRHYPLGVHVTATDISKRMIEKARSEANEHGVNSEFVISAVDDLQFPAQSFDTIVSTFSLSSYENPGLVLSRFNEWCKPDGKILLLEYGLSRNGLVNWVQRNWAPVHYKRTGTHIARDMLTIISGSKLRVKKVEVRYAGIVYLVWAALSPAA